MKRAQLAALSIVLSICLMGCSGAVVKGAVATAGTELPPPPVQETISITAVGDIMMHNTQLKAGFQKNSGTYDYSDFFRFVQPIFSASDLVIGNLETTLAGKAAGYSGYPRFNSPDILASNLKDAGFDLLTTANNHSLDKGYEGLASTLDRLDEAGLLHTGTSRSPAEQAKSLIVDLKGSKFGILAYTYGTNGLNPPKNRTYAVNYLEESRITSDIKKARDSGAQFVIVSLHFGLEYQQKPNSEQIKLAQNLLKNGADMILGSHPHVLQPAFIIDEKFVIYSLGNFISDQTGLERKSSIILNLQFDVDPLTKQPSFQTASYIPIWTHRYVYNGQAQFAVLPIEQALISYKAGQATTLTAKDAASLEQAWQHVTNHLKSDSSQIHLHNISTPLTNSESTTKL